MSGGVLPELASSAIGASRPAPPRRRRFMPVPAASWPKILAPIVAGLLGLLGWEALVRLKHIPDYVLPGPLTILHTLVTEWGSLSGSLAVTLTISLAALSAAVVLGLLLAILFTQSRWIELSLLPYAVVLQVTPIVALAPLIILWVDNTWLSLLICAWIVAFFPILSNTTLGLHSADHNLVNLFRLYRATRWQTLLRLKLPSALPYFLGGLRISGGLSLIGAVVAEFVAGTGGASSGLAYRILESGYQLKIPRMFAALVMISASGVVIFACLSLISYLALHRWHESAVQRET